MRLTPHCTAESSDEHHVDGGWEHGEEAAQPPDGTFDNTVKTSSSKSVFIFSRSFSLTVEK